MKTFCEVVATYFFAGKLTKMPGTVGSLLSFPLLPIILINNFVAISFLILIFLISIYCVDKYLQYYYEDSSDPKEVVIDEVLGQLLTVFIVLFIMRDFLNISLNGGIINQSWLFLLCFIFFRFFDITKIWPINLIDRNVKGSLGIMLDDIIAAVLAALVIVCLYFILLRFNILLLK